MNGLRAIGCLVAVLLAGMGLLRPGAALGVGLDPDSGHPAPALDFWGFSDTNWLTHYGHAPVSSTNLVNVPSLGDGNALLLDSPDPAWLQYPINQNGTNLLTVDRGSLMFWFAAASWSGTNLGGAGIGQWGRLIEVGSYTEDASFGWWSLYFSPAGDTIYFSAQTNGAGATYLSAPVAFTTNRWHLIALTYSSTNSALYLDGEIVTNGLPVTYWPGPEVLSNGFCIGSDSSSGLAQARAMFDSLSTYDYVLDADTIAGAFQTSLASYYLNPMNKANDIASAPSTPEMIPSFRAITGPGYLNPLTNAVNCVSNSNIWITNVVVSAVSNGTMNLRFEIAGGEDGVLYDVFANSVLSPASSTNAWAWMGQGLHCVTYLLTNLPNTSAFLILGQPTDDDGDGLTTAWERLVGKTDPFNADTDGDGLLDGEEVGLYFTDPKNQDSDGDGVIDQPFRVIVARPANNSSFP